VERRGIRGIQPWEKGRRRRHKLSYCHLNLRKGVRTVGFQKFRTEGEGRRKKDRNSSWETTPVDAVESALKQRSQGGR